jgi:hypothetical protein
MICWVICAASAYLPASSSEVAVYGGSSACGTEYTLAAGVGGPSCAIAVAARRLASAIPAASPSMARQRISWAASLACATDPGCPLAWPRRAAAAEASGSPWYQAISDRVSAAQPSSSG